MLCMSGKNKDQANEKSTQEKSCTTNDGDIDDASSQASSTDSAIEGNNEFEMVEKHNSEDGSCVSDGELPPFSDFVSKPSVRKVLSLDQAIETEIEVSEDLLMQYLTKPDKKMLKLTLRKCSWTPDHKIRLSLWKQLCKHLHNTDGTDMYEEFEQELFGQALTTDDVRLPAFVDDNKIKSFHLHDDGILHAKKVISIIEHTKPDITHSPALFSLVCLFLHYMEPSECYNCIYGLLSCKDSAFIHQTKVSMEATKFVMRDLSKKYTKSAYIYLLRNCANIDDVFDSWVWWILHDLPFSYLVRVIDCYLLEGVKILYRVALALLMLYVKVTGKKSPSKQQDSSNNSLVTLLRQFCREMPVNVEKMLKTAFSIRGLSRKEIRKLQLKHEMYINSRSHVQDVNSNGLPMSRSFSGPIVLQSFGSDLLSSEMCFHLRRKHGKVFDVDGHYQLTQCEKDLFLRNSSNFKKGFKDCKLYSVWTWLPRRFAVCQPELLFTSEEHGHSLITLFQRVENHQPTLIVIKSVQDEMFGAFCSTCWRERKQQRTKNLSYFGTGETFIFTLHPEKRKYDWVGLRDENIPNTANMFQAGDRSVLTIGGGHGEAILLDENLLHCRTETCDTFKNEPLCEKEDFQCKVVEVYGFC